MNDAVRFLCQNSALPISVQPNAGLPQNEGGHAVYKLTPAELASWLRRFVTEYGVQVVGGCCGTTPEHLRAVAEAVKGIQPARAPSSRNRSRPAPSRRRRSKPTRSPSSSPRR
jgi:5-methyltetrahydrofolate--homocysteine methyltransferase